jgi:hypothetical protein
MIRLFSIGDNSRQTMETCDNKNSDDIYTRKHIWLIYFVSTHPVETPR